VAFRSIASNLVPGDDEGQGDTFVANLAAGTLVRISESAGGAGGDDTSWDASISASGGTVVFFSEAANLVDGDGNGDGDAFLWTAASGSVVRVSVNADGVEANATSYVHAQSLSPNGKWIVVASAATNLTPGLADFFHSKVFLLPVP
jgi:Tol biopolymer transport system component